MMTMMMIIDDRYLSQTYTLMALFQLEDYDRMSIRTVFRGWLCSPVKKMMNVKAEGLNPYVRVGRKVVGLLQRS